MIYFRYLIISLSCCLFGVNYSVAKTEPAAYAEQNSNSPFPRLLGMNIGAKNYDDKTYQQDMAKLNVVILAFYKTWAGKQNESIKDVVLALKRLNPNLLIGQYTIVNETLTSQHDLVAKLDAENWWLTDDSGNKLQWTSKYNAWDINITEWTKPDINGMRYPEWHALTMYKNYFESAPFDIWYYDNVFFAPYDKKADWKLIGSNQSNADQDIQIAFRKAIVSNWSMAKKLAPNLIMMGNICIGDSGATERDNDLSSPEYKNQLSASFIEAAIGANFSMETRHGWDYLMNRYHTIINNTYQPDKTKPKIVGFNVWGAKDDYKTMRYGLTSSLMDDGYFSYSDVNDSNGGYSSVPWFDEYDIKLGQAITPPQTKPWQDSVYRRDFENGIALVNSNRFFSATVILENGFKHFLGKQDSDTNDGSKVTKITLKPRDGIILINDN